VFLRQTQIKFNLGQQYMIESAFSENFVYFALPVLAYLLGSVPFGIVLTRLFAAVDIRDHGSGNIGATNVSRVAGPVVGLLTLVGDILKGAIPVFLALRFVGTFNPPNQAYLAVVALAAFIGHLYPIYLRFKTGGKGVATAAGCFLVLAPYAVLLALAGFILLVWLSGRVSVGSLSAAVILPVTVWFFTGSGYLTIGAAIISALIFIRHRDNIKRLMQGTEPDFRDKKRPQ